MSHDDPYRPDPNRDRGVYTPPDGDELPFDRANYDRGGYDPRRSRGPVHTGSGKRRPPLTLIISAVVLLALIVAVAVYYRAGPRASSDAPPAVGRPVEGMTTEAPVDAQPIDPTAGIDVYDETQAPTTAPTYAPEPEAVQPRPTEPSAEPVPVPAPTRPRLDPAQNRETGGPEIVRVTPDPKAAPAPAATGGNSGVQIGAFSTPDVAQREYDAVVGRYGSLTRGASRRVQEVTTSAGQTVYRTTITNLSRDQAQRLCSAMRADGEECLVR